MGVKTAPGSSIALPYYGFDYKMHVFYRDMCALLYGNTNVFLYHTYMFYNHAHVLSDKARVCRNHIY